MKIIDANQNERFVKNENGVWFYCVPGNYGMIPLTDGEVVSLVDSIKNGNCNQTHICGLRRWGVA